MGLRLVAATSSTIANYGMKTFNLTFSGHRFSWTLILSDVKVPLLGADFITHYQLLVDITCSHRLLVNTASKFQHLRCFILNITSFLIFLPNVEFIIISRRWVLLCMPASDSFLQRSFERLNRHSPYGGNGPMSVSLKSLGLPISSNKEGRQPLVALHQLSSS